MRRGLAIAARFLLFHSLSVYATAFLSASIIMVIGRENSSLAHRLAAAADFSAGMSLRYGLLLLPASVLGWWVGGQICDKMGTAPARRPGFQGAMAGLFAFIAMGFLTAMIPPNIIGLPIGAFFGWLIYRRLWPNLPAAAQGRTTP